MKNHIQLRNPIVIVNENNLETTIPIPKTNIDTDKTQWCSPIQEGKDKGKMVCIDPESITTIR